MTRYFTIILILGLVFSQEQEFIYSTLVDTSLEHDPFFGQVLFINLMSKVLIWSK